MKTRHKVIQFSIQKPFCFNVIVPKLDPAENEPNDHAPVTHAGTSETVSTAPV